MAFVDNYDFRLTIDGKEYGFILAEQDGVKQYSESLAPFITPQFRTEGFGYDHTPPEIEVPSVSEDWFGGCGYDLSASGGSVTSNNRYNYSQGLDLSHNDRIFVSPKRQTTLESDGSAIAAAPTKFYNSSLGLFLLAGAYIYEYDLTTATWVERDDASGDAVNYKDITELDGVLYASRGSGADYKYSTDGTTWTAFTDADQNADYFTTRGNSSDIAALWKVLGNLIRNTTDGQNGGVSWSGADEVGHSSETARGAITVNNDIFVFKQEGVYVYDGTNTQDIWKTTNNYSGNGLNPFAWVNGFIYVPYGRRLIQFDPFTTDGTIIRPVYPIPGMDSQEVLGDITAIGGDDYNLYFALKNRAGNTYIMKGVPGNGWHTYIYLGANDCNALAVLPPGVAHTTNPVLMVGYGTAASYYILSRENRHPTDDPLYRFDTTASRFAVGSYANFGAKTYSKFLNHAAILGYNLSSGRPATLHYEIDRSGSTTALVAAVADGLTDTSTSTEVAFGQIRWWLYMDTGDTTATPTVDSISLFATMNPERKRMWQMTCILSDDIRLRGGVHGTTQPSVGNIHEIIFGAATKRITFTTQHNDSYTVRLLGSESVGNALKQIGGQEYHGHGQRLTLVEIGTLTNNLPTGKYGDVTYGSGVVYA